MIELRLVLRKECKKASKVFIIGHNDPDFDALGSVLGLGYIAQQLNDNVYLIIDKVKDNGIKNIRDSFKDQFQIINACQFNKLRDDDSLVIMSDVNKKELLAIDKNIDKVNNIIIVDHHALGPTTVKTDKVFIDTTASSASEIVTRLLTGFKFAYPSEIANLLMAGIVLDTARYSRNVTSKTHDVAEKLYKMGADGSYVNSLFLEKFDIYKKVHNLIVNETIIKKYKDELLPIQVSFSLNRSRPTTIYKREELAKVVDNMMQFEFDAAIAIGFISKDSIYISIRSKENINAAEVISGIGGGDSRRAAALVKSNNILEIEKQVMRIVDEAIMRMKKEKKALQEETLILELDASSKEKEANKVKVLKSV